MHLVDPYLSIIIPAYNEAKRLPRTLEKVLRFAESQPYEVEILVVENGSQDNTYQIAKEIAADHPVMDVIHVTERGKGLAIKNGMLRAKGEFRFMADADLSMPIEEISLFLPPKLSNYDVAIGSREAPGSVRYNEPFYRHLGGRAINTIIRLLALPGLHDTQCGFKCFQAAAAEDLFNHLTLTGWSFDIELLYVARLRGYRIVEVPISWHFNPESKLNVVQDAMRMLLDILSIRMKAQRGEYEKKQAPVPDPRFEL